MTVSDRGHVLALVAEAVEHGARQHTLVQRIGVDMIDPMGRCQEGPQMLFNACSNLTS